MWDEYSQQLTKPDEVAAGHCFLHQQPLPSADEVASRDAIRRMARYHVIERDEKGAYGFEVPFIERWVRERVGLA